MADSLDGARTERGHVIVHSLVALFGISAWIGVNAIFIQLPVLINVSPEGWNLPVYVVLITQSANIGPIVYAVLRYIRSKPNEEASILLLLGLGTLAMGFLSFFHSATVTVAGTEHSLPLLILLFFNALVGCFSSVLFMPYLQTFSKVYLISYFIGEGLSGVLPSIVALVQGIEDCETATNDTLPVSSSGLRFPPRDYFAFVFAVLLLSLIAFINLQYSSFVQDRKRVVYCSDTILDKAQANCRRPDKVDDPSGKKKQTSRCLHTESKLKYAATTRASKRIRRYLFLLLGLSCFLSNSFFPSVQPYSCLPYGNLAYKLSVILAQFANPLACLLALWLITSNTRIISYLCIVCLFLGSSVTYLALLSPSPPLQGTKAGTTLVILLWTILMGVISYLKLTIVSVFRSMTAPDTLFTVGAIMQAGSAMGAIVSFVLINFTNAFEMYDRCVSSNN